MQAFRFPVPMRFTLVAVLMVVGGGVYADRTTPCLKYGGSSGRRRAGTGMLPGTGGSTNPGIAGSGDGRFERDGRNGRRSGEPVGPPAVARMPAREGRRDGRVWTRTGGAAGGSQSDGGRTRQRARQWRSQRRLRRGGVL